MWTGSPGILSAQFLISMIEGVLLKHMQDAIWKCSRWFTWNDLKGNFNSQTNEILITNFSVFFFIKKSE